MDEKFGIFINLIVKLSDAYFLFALKNRVNERFSCLCVSLTASFAPFGG